MFGIKKEKQEVPDKNATKWGQNREDLIHKVSKLEDRVVQLELKIKQLSVRLGL